MAYLASQRGEISNKIPLVSYLVGLGAVALALLSPIDWLGGQLFFMHMIQHLLTIMIAAPLIWLSEPFPIALWGVPESLRKSVARLFFHDAPLARFLNKAFSPGFSWLLFVIFYLGWHEPELYNLALRRGWVHDIEHITFFGAALIYWWHVVDAAPYLRKRLSAWGRIGFLIATIPPNMLAGVFISFAGTPIYTYYESVPPIWGLSTMQDQQLGGAIMWIPGSMMFFAGALIILAIEMSRAEQEKLKQREWNSEEALVAPGLEHRVIQNKWRNLENK